MDDIEDTTGAEPRQAHMQVVPKRPRRRAPPDDDVAEPSSDPATGIDANAVGSDYWSASTGNHALANERIFMRTWGCSHNNSDSEYMAGLLAAHGYGFTDDPQQAALWLLNSCTVKTPAEESFNGLVRAGLAAGKPVVVAGCVPQGAPRGPVVSGLSMVGVNQIDRVVEVVEETLKGNTVRLVGPKKGDGTNLGGPRLDLPKIRRNPWIEIISINSGCLNRCTYCKTKHARGDLASYTVAELSARVAAVVAEGVVEIWLTSEDTGAYGRDIGTDLPTLLRALVTLLPPGTMLRLGMTNPPYMLEHLSAMAELLRHPRVYAFLHVPVQSASDEVLYNMKREYTAADFRRIVDTLRGAVPGMTLATDLIVGFPGETDAHFAETLRLVQDYKFPVLFTNQFFPRPGTPAASMKRVPTHIVKQRTKIVTEFFHTYSPYAGREGQEYDILITEMATDNVHLVGHNKFYEQVLVPFRADLMGKWVRVIVVRTGKFFLMGAVIEASVPPSRPPPPMIALPSGKEGSERHRKQLLSGLQKHQAADSAAPSICAQEHAPVREAQQQSGSYVITAVFAVIFAVLGLDLVYTLGVTWDLARIFGFPM